jgi:hypothetical protein
MRFADYLTVPAGTTFNNPATKIVRLSYGIITEIEITFPAGCAGLVHLAIDHYEHQAFPTNPDRDFIGDDHTTTLSDSYPVTEAPYSVKLRGWAPTTTLSHNVYVELSVLPPPFEAEQPEASVALPEGFTP